MGVTNPKSEHYSTGPMTAKEAKALTEALSKSPMAVPIMPPGPPAPKPSKVPEAVDHPSHYNTGKIEVIDFIEDQGFGFNDGNAIKYISRHMHKGTAVKDIEKAIWYLQRHKENLIERGF